MKSAELPVAVAPRAPARVRREDLEFLPAALEVIETPPSPVGRAIGATVILFFVAALAWACIGEVDIIATAQGKVVPTGRTKVIQPFEIGVVRAIHVQEGQAVKAGDVLIELDTTINSAERDRLAKELLSARLDVARLETVLSEAADAVAAFAVPAGATALQAELSRRLAAAQIAEHRAKLAGIDRQMAQNQANRAAVAATVAKIAEAIPLLEQRATARKTLVDKEYGSKLTWLEVQQDLVEHQHELTVQQARLAEAAASLAALAEQRQQAAAEYRRANLTDLAQAEQKAAGLQQELVKADEHRNLQTLTAPVDGTVQQLAVHTVGGVVTPAQALLAVVPADSRLEVEAMVSNRDIGFVRADQSAEVKIDTFNFTRYGLLHGRVINVSQDAVLREQPADKSTDKGGALSDSSEPQGQTLNYVARIALDRTEMQVEDKLVSLTPGMAVTAEIRTGSRRVIDYLLSPLLRYKQQGLRER